MPSDTRLPFSMLGKYEVGGQPPQRRLRHSRRPIFEPALAVECGGPLEQLLCLNRTEGHERLLYCLDASPTRT
jgi:hypothetical protein